MSLLAYHTLYTRVSPNLTLDVTPSFSQITRFHQTSHLVVGFIVDPALHLKLSANSFEFDKGPITLKKTKGQKHEHSVKKNTFQYGRLPMLEKSTNMIMCMDSLEFTITAHTNMQSPQGCTLMSALRIPTVPPPRGVH